MNSGYAKGIVVPEGMRLLHFGERIEKGDLFMADTLDDPMPVEACVGMTVEETPFVAVFRKEAPCSTS
jgi:hypothetical protein